MPDEGRRAGSGDNRRTDTSKNREGFGLTEKIRADVALVSRGIVPTREKAQAAIMAGQVFIGDRRVRKPSETVLPEDPLSIRNPEVRYVSRGALKLEKALKVFHADILGRTVADIGASTGGFTDVCLQNGAAHVYAVDVGYGQLDWKLRNDPRVTVMERTNARHLKVSDFQETPSVAVMDVSFISIRLILPAIFSIIGDQGVIYTLIKPQFEAGKNKVGKNGIVRDPATHEEVLNEIMNFSLQNGWPMRKIDYSPITGAKGNIEFIAEIRKYEEGAETVSTAEIKRVIREAHREML